VPRTGLVALVAVVVALGAGAFLALRDAGGVPDVPPLVLPAEAADPFAYSEKRRQDFERRAAQGLAHVLYEKSPGGIVASARRTARWRPLVEGVASEARLDADLIEAIVLLESAGRPDAVADPELEGAVGLTQILAGTGQGLLGMRVDVAASRRLTRRIQRVRGRGEPGRAKRLERLRRRVDHRFDPRLALEGTARYLDFAQGELGRDDLALVSYHMGVGNLTSVIEDFGEADRPSYARLYFESSPSSHRAAWRRLAELGDDSSTYLWRVLAARDIMRRYREDRGALARRDELQTAKNSAEEVLHPGDETERYASPDDLEDAYGDDELRPFPQAPGRTGLRRDRAMGELAGRLDVGRDLYRGLRPEAYALALYMARLTREAGGGDAPLTVTSTVRDEAYQALLAKGNPEATGGYSLHTTGFAFDVLRRYSGDRQAVAFQFALDRLEALNLIAWVREPAAIHVTAAGDARVLLGQLEEEGQ
jgi:hypothetical protein